jgi:hypothetical protein
LLATWNLGMGVWIAVAVAVAMTLFAHWLETARTD